MEFPKIALKVPEILFPKKGIDLTTWAVVACDQFTSEHEYWDEIDQLVKGHPSTRHLILPEAHLEREDLNAEIEAINQSMHSYLQSKTLENLGKCFILVDRKTSHHPSRKGLIAALDLEQYDYNKGSTTLIRATEGTVIERLPPRIKVRENAPLELPHIMVLIDDPQKEIIEPLFEKNFECIADFELMKNSGHIKSYKINKKSDLEAIATKIENLLNSLEKPALLYAMGDGNHSLATAKSIWESKKLKGATLEDPARYALVELVNLHDDGIVFEPIHRILFNVNTTHLFNEMQQFFKKQDADCSHTRTQNLAEAKKLAKHHNALPNTHAIAFMRGADYGALIIKKPTHNLSVGTLQNFIDAYLKQNPSAAVDYIHGEDVVSNLAGNPGNIGFYFEGMSKYDLFPTVIKEGALPRKTFSMGEADEKRFYLECRKIIK